MSPTRSAVATAPASARRRASIAAVLLLVALLAATLAPSAFALPPGGPHERPEGATVAVRKIVPPVGATGTGIVDPGKVSFTGSGFAAGETVYVKIDDGAVGPDPANPPTLPPGANSADALTAVDAEAGGTISGAVDLAQVNPAVAGKVATGKHALRFVSGSRSLHGDFVVTGVVGSGPGPNSANPGGATVVVGPPADQPVAWDAGTPFSGMPKLFAGAALPFRATGFSPNQIVSIKVDDGNAAYRPAAPLPDPVSPGNTLPVDVWERFRVDASGSYTGFLDVPTTGVHAGTHWLRVLGDGGTGTTRSLTAGYEILPADAGRTVTVGASGQRGRSVAVSGSGLLRDPFYRDGYRDGQTVTVRLDGTGPPVQLRAANDGTLVGELPLPADTPLGTHSVTAWVGFHAGGDDPQVVVERPFEVTEYVPEPQPTPVAPIGGGVPPVTTPAPSPMPTTVPPTVPERAATVASRALKVAKGRVALKLGRGSVARKASVTVRTSAKVRVGKRTKRVTVAKLTRTTLKAGTAKQTTTVRLKLTAEGRALLKRVAKVRVVVRVAPQGGKAVSRTVWLRG